MMETLVSNLGRIKILLFFNPNNVLLEKLGESPLFDYKIYRYGDVISGRIGEYDFDVLVAAPFHRVGREVIKLLPKLRLIIIHGSGTDNVDINYASKKGILVFNIPDYIAVTVAEHAMALILALIRKIVVGDRLVREGRWEKGAPSKDLVGSVIRGKTIGIVGLGRIGSELARIIYAFRPKAVYYWNRRRKPEVEHALNIEYKGLKQLFESSDIIIVSIALTPDTERLINRELIMVMKPGSIIINISRGRVIDEDALIDALERGVIGGAGLDVYWDEPLPKGNRLISLENAVLTPHVGGFSDYSSYYTALDVFRILVEFYINNNVPLENLVNKDALSNRHKDVNI